MNEIDVVATIKNKFQRFGSRARIPLLRGNRTFKAELKENGIMVDNLSNQPFLPWEVFEEAVLVLDRNGGHTQRGDAMNSKLGDSGLPLNSVEGHIAHAVYGKKVGESVFRRITPIAGILIWAGVCRAAPGELILC